MPRKYDAEEYVTLFDKRRCKFSKVVGFCHNLSHRGYVSKPLLKSHECVEKKCPLFERYNHNYWTQIEKIRCDKQKHHESVRIKKLQAAEREEFICSVFKPYDHIYITSIREIGYGLMITYIYDAHIIPLFKHYFAMRRK